MNSFTLVLLIVAIIIFVRLYRSLGTRNKNYKEQERAYKSAMPSALASMRTRPVLSPMPTRRKVSINAKSSDAELQNALRCIQAIEPEFTIMRFRSQAEKAYRYILQAYAKGDVAKLKPLLAPALYKQFRESIETRTQAKQTLRTEILSMTTPEICNITLRGNMAHVNVMFTCDLLSVLTDDTGAVLEGDKNVAVALCDLWGLTRRLGDNDPSWILTKVDSTLKKE